MTDKVPDQPMCYPKHSRLSKREATFEHGWPEPLLGKIPDIARAGFYYKGVKDSTTCFHCGFTLTNWDPEDDPYAEHAYWNLNCPYINLYKGRGWVMNVFIAGLDQHGYKLLTEIKPLLNPEPDVQARGKCHICLDKELEIAFLPCGHRQNSDQCVESSASLASFDVSSSKSYPGTSRISSGRPESPDPRPIPIEKSNV
ncbi:baculoviral IAP repeat-containing protein 3-like [Saccostrea cucullata]|uniref:baculoviral IAP repeat-containing protein 3-like n=1 Tax=Saccostrea cuccullata TaxID=36930 RepID=UPI002ED4E576